MELLKNKVALITGSGGGIGEGVARYFVKQGASVVVSELNEGLGERVAEDLRALGGNAVFVKTDVSSKASIGNAIEAAAREFGGLDVLVNNAFAPTPNVLFEEKTDEEEDAYAEELAGADEPSAVGTISRDAQLRTV